MNLELYMDMLFVWAAANLMIPAMMLKIPVRTRNENEMKPKAWTAEVVICILNY